MVKKLFYNRISANQLTLLALITGLLSSLSIFLSGILTWVLGLIITAIILMGISFFLDVLDGSLARIEGPTVLGGILDIFCDRTVEVFIIISIISTDPVSLMWPGIFSLGAIVLCITLFLLIGGAVKAEELENTKKVIYYRHSLMERSETLIFLFFMTILIPFRNIILWIFFILVFITSLLRLRDVFRLFKIK
ncbi:MAG: CDP-alcohol phosphatidyltransferase family protein [Promethearchaeota archaeon]